MLEKISKDSGRINCRWPLWFTSVHRPKSCIEDWERHIVAPGPYTSVCYCLQEFEMWIKSYASQANRLTKCLLEATIHAHANGSKCWIFTYIFIHTHPHIHQLTHTYRYMFWLSNNVTVWLFSLVWICILSHRDKKKIPTQHIHTYTKKHSYT